MKRLNSDQVHKQTIVSLGLNPAKHSLTSIEAIAASLRRAAGFLCPCVESTLIRSVIRPMRGLVPDIQTVKALAKDTLEQMIALGDFHEYRDFTDSSAVVLYAAQCSFVTRKNGSVVLVGISADQTSVLPTDLEERIEAVGCVRVLRPLPGESLRDDLYEIGLIEIPYKQWVKMPRFQNFDQHISDYDQRLTSKPSTGEIPGLQILDSTSHTRFYRKRWIEPKDQTGNFIARRDQAYGAALWCYVHLENGQPQHLLDFPLLHSRWRGCDEAWHLQMAIDARQGHPQEFSLRAVEPGTHDLIVYSPIPMWAQRRWDAIGEWIKPKDGLTAFRFPDSEIDEESRFARTAMWLEQARDGM